MKGTPLGTPRRRLSTGVVAAACALGGAGESASADEIQVTNTAAKGRGSFAAAVSRADADPGRDVITFRRSLRGTIPVPREIEINTQVAISGRGYGDPSSRAFGRLRLQGPEEGSELDFEGVGYKAPHPKAAIRGMYLDRVSVMTNNSRVDVVRSHISGDGTARGAGFDATYGYDKPARIERSTITGWEQGVDTYRASVQIDASVISHNEGAGGVEATNGHIRITESLVSGNTGVSGGVFGGYYGGVSVANSTITGNVATGSLHDGTTLGGGVSGYVEVNESTITANSAERGGGIGNYVTGVEVTNSIVAGNESTDPSVGEDCASYLNSDGGNLIGSPGSCPADPRDLIGVDPLLTRLGDRGGPTPTYGLRPGSPAIGLAIPKTATRFDQRGVRRDRNPDSGAFERR